MQAKPTRSSFPLIVHALSLIHILTETSFNPTAKFEEAFIERKEMEYSYMDDNLYYFMDTETYDMIPLNADQLGDAFKFVKENTLPL